MACFLVHAKPFSRVQLFETLWTVAHQALLSTGFSRQEYWSGLPRPSAGDLPNPRLNLSLMSPVLAGGFLPLATPGKPDCLWLDLNSSSQVVGRTLSGMWAVFKVRTIQVQGPKPRASVKSHVKDKFTHEKGICKETNDHILHSVWCPLYDTYKNNSQGFPVNHHLPFTHTMVQTRNLFLQL